MSRKLYHLARSKCHVNSIPTLFFTVTPVEPIKKLDARVIIITGNPGICDYYISFAVRLLQATKCNVCVDCIDQAGHSGLENKCYSLDEQIQHKIDYINQCIPSNEKLILIGHSIGAYIALQLVKVFPREKIIKSFMLFPTIERMAVSPQGRKFAPKFASVWYRLMISYTCWTVSFLPTFLLKAIARRYHYHGVNDIDEYCVEATSRLINKKAISNVLYMADTEMRQVVDLNIEDIKANLDRLYFYYGASDAWTPRSYYEKLSELFPNGEIYLDTHNMPHAFVIHSSGSMAQLTANEIDNLFS